MCDDARCAVVPGSVQQVQQISSFDPDLVLLSCSSFPVAQRIVSVIDNGHCLEAANWALHICDEVSALESVLQPAVCLTAKHVFDEMPEWIPEAGKEPVLLLKQGFVLPTNSSVDGYDGWRVGSSLPYADLVKDVRTRRSDTLDIAEGYGREKVVFTGLKPLPNSFAQLMNDQLVVKDKAGVISPSIKDGRPAIMINDEELREISKPLQLTLIGKFPAGRPKWVSVNKFFLDLKLKGEFKIVNLDARHMYIHLQHGDDYCRLFSKQFQYIDGFLMKLLKWTLEFNVNNEPSVCPVWISLPMLGLHLYTSSMLFSIASIYGRPLGLDYATSHWTRPNSARILVEMDVKLKHSNEVWIGSELNGYVQKVCFENLPSYCMHCRKSGHCDDNCFLLYPELRKEQVQKKLNSKRQDINTNICSLSEADKAVMSGENVFPSVSNFQLAPVREDETELGYPGMNEAPAVGSLPGSLDRDVGELYQKLAGVESSDLQNGLDISSLDIMEGQALIESEKQLLQLENIGKGCNQWDDVSMDGNSMGSELDISPRGELFDAFDFSLVGCKFHEKDSSSKRFTRSSLKDIDGQQVGLQWFGTGKKRGKRRK